jgi:hypothetical protein
MVTLKALVDQRFAGRMLLTGEVFEATEAEARTLMAIRRAMLAEVNTEAPRKKRQYRRRDLTSSQYEGKAL